MALHTKILLGLVAGATAGILAHVFAADATWVAWLTRYVAEPAGNIFLRMLLMTVIPLVFASIVLGVLGIGDIRQLGRMGGRTLTYFLFTTALAATLGLTLVNVVDPGGGMDTETRDKLLETFSTQTQVEPATFGIHTIVNIVPRNPVQAAASMDMLGVIFFALMFGVGLLLVGEERAAPLAGVIRSLSDVVMKIIELAMKLAPYGVFGLMFVTTSRFGWHLLEQLGAYVAVVLTGLALHAAVTLSLLVRVLGRMSPIEFWKRSRAVIVTAFSTSSSNATLPTTITIAERELGVPRTVAGFVLPLGATMNMNGTALFEGVTVLFLAQVFGVDLSLGQQIVVAMLAVITAIGAAGVPGGSIPLLMMVLAAIGVPPEGIAIILGVDRLLDMCRTTLNVAGDLTAALYVARSTDLASTDPASTDPAKVVPAPDGVVSRGEVSP